MAKDRLHEEAKKSLENDGWTITHDPYPLKDKSIKMNYDIDLGAERILAAEKGNEKIAVEVKSFLQASFSHEFHSVLGQYLVYLQGLEKIEPERNLFLAIPFYAYLKLKEHALLLEIIEKFNVQFLVFDEENKIITSWKK